MDIDYKRLYFEAVGRAESLLSPAEIAVASKIFPEQRFGDNAAKETLVAYFSAPGEWFGYPHSIILDWIERQTQWRPTLAQVQALREVQVLHTASKILSDTSIAALSDLHQHLEVLLSDTPNT